MSDPKGHHALLLQTPSHTVAATPSTVTETPILRTPLLALSIDSNRPSPLMQPAEDEWWTPEPCHAVPSVHALAVPRAAAATVATDHATTLHGQHLLLRSMDQMTQSAAGCTGAATNSNSSIYMVSRAPLLPTSPDFSPTEQGQYRYRPPPCFSPDILQLPIPMVRPVESAPHISHVACRTTHDGDDWTEPPTSLDALLAPSRPPPLPLMATPELVARRTVRCLLEMRRDEPPPLLLPLDPCAALPHTPVSVGRS